MARFARIDSQIEFRANCLTLVDRFRVRFPNWTFFFCELRFGELKIANRRFEAIRANRSHVMKIGFFFFFRANRFARIAPIRVANRRAI